MTVTKRRITTAERHLHATIAATNRILARWDRCTTITRSRIPDVLRAAGGSSGGRGSDVADPVGTIVVARLAADELTDQITALWVQARWLAVHLVGLHGARVTTPTAQLGRVVVYAGALLDRWPTLHDIDPDHVAAVAALKAEAFAIEDAIATILDGHGPASAAEAEEAAQAKRNARCSGEWDPLCWETAATDRRGMCIRCYTNQRRGVPSPVLASATADVLGSASVEPCAPRATALVVPGIGTTGTCGRCGATFTGHPGDIVADLEAHHFVCPGR